MTELPSPSVPYINQLKNSVHSAEALLQEQPATPSRQPSQREFIITSSQNMRENSVATSETDPWGSPELHRSHGHTSATGNEPAVNGYNTVRSNSIGWDAAGATYSSTSQSQNGLSSSDRPGQTSQNPTSWSGTYNPTSGEDFGTPSQPSITGFRPPNDGQGGSNTPSRAIGGGRITGGGVEEVVTITMLPEKEGMFMFQHRNYEVKSARRGSSVVRRYSDFVWLLDCLQKRYPFRQLPLLPPKRVAGTSRLLNNSLKILLTLFI
jgi:sorting nexin-8